MFDVLVTYCIPVVTYNDVYCNECLRLEYQKVIIDYCSIYITYTVTVLSFLKLFGLMAL